ncbi:putative inactive purple acid phosphatase 27 [Drosera capensis]
MISEYRLINRESLFTCPIESRYIQISAENITEIANEQFITVNISGVIVPAKDDWVAMISPSTSKRYVEWFLFFLLQILFFCGIGDCPLDELMYAQTGDLSSLPLICHYPVKAQYVKNDPGYLSCQNPECQDYLGDVCIVKTCAASLTFHVVNIRTDIEFVFFAGGFITPCILKRSTPLKFANPNMPSFGHLSSIDSTATSIRLTWVSGDQKPQQIQYGNGKRLRVPRDFGWHDPGYIHTAVMTGLEPSSTYSYKYGSDLAGWSDQIQFHTPPAGGSNELNFLAYGDIGKASLDESVEHHIQPGSISVVEAMTAEVTSGNVDSIFHIGDISYATGFLAEVGFFLSLIEPIASRVSYMSGIGVSIYTYATRDYIGSGSVYITPDSGGECGVAYETYFPLPTSAKDKPWYSIEQGPVHFTLVSTEHDWSPNSEQLPDAYNI